MENNFFLFEKCHNCNHGFVKMVSDKNPYCLRCREYFKAKKIFNAGQKYERSRIQKKLVELAKNKKIVFLK